jgi:hypothetical protein
MTSLASLASQRDVGGAPQSAPKLNRVPIGKKKIKSPPIIYLDRRENLEPAGIRHRGPEHHPARSEKNRRGRSATARARVRGRQGKTLEVNR